MTESEFQEFMITVGYRYNEKSKTAFNSFEGFKTLIEFLEKDSKYMLTLSAGTSGSVRRSEAENKLKEFAEEHKSHIIKWKHTDKSIKIILKMTIDSDIDKEELKKLVHFMTELMKSGCIVPLCKVCARQRKTGLYVIGKELSAVCDPCINRKRRQYEIRKNKFIKKKQYMAGGIIGALFGAGLGACIYIFLYQLIPTYGLGGVLIIVLSFTGFVVTGKRATKKSAVICGIISVIVFLLAEYTAMVANMAVLIERAGGGIAVSEAMEVINSSFGDITSMSPIIWDTIIGIILMSATGFLYFLKRKYTRPLKISKNIL